MQIQVSEVGIFLANLEQFLAQQNLTYGAETREIVAGKFNYWSRNTSISTSKTEN